MKDCSNETKCLASLAVFRELYNSKNDVYDVISQFLKEIIINNSKHQFSLTEITKLLNSTFDFNLPDAIVQTSLKRIDFIVKDQGQYVATDLASQKRPEIDETREHQQIKNNIILEQLFMYIQGMQEDKLTEIQKETIVSSFCSFLLDDSNGHEYSEYISAFIISKSKDSEFTDQLNYIKEGIVLYSGIKYNSNINNLGSWNTPLTIYIETEILFHFVGYNGEVYKSLFNDFLSYVKEINTKANKKLITLKYFLDVKDEIERFFKKAEYIVIGQDKVNPSNTAMKSIIDGCMSAADVIIKKTLFYDLLNKNDIKEDEHKDYYNEENHKYNIIDKATITRIANEIENNEIDETIVFLNYISIQRKGNYDSNFENIKVILLSGNSTTLKVAWHNEIKEQGKVPLATNLSFITNKFWFKLNKGFGKGNYPKTFDIITKAQIILSSQLNNTVRINYDELQKKFKKGEITEEQAVASIASLRNQSRNPENIVADEISSILDSISEDKIQNYLEEHEHLKNKVEKEEKNNSELRKTIVSKDEEIKNKDLLIKNEQQRKKQKEIDLQKGLLESKKQLLNEKIRNKESLESQKKPLDDEALHEFKNLKIRIAVYCIIYYILTTLLIWQYDMNFIAYIIEAIIPVLISIIFVLITEKSINISSYLKNKKKDILSKKYSKFKFDLKRLIDLDKEINTINNEIKSKEYEINSLMSRQ